MYVSKNAETNFWLNLASIQPRMDRPNFYLPSCPRHRPWVRETALVESASQKSIRAFRSQKARRATNAAANAAQEAAHRSYGSLLHRVDDLQKLNCAAKMKTSLSVCEVSRFSFVSFPDESAKMHVLHVSSFLLLFSSWRLKICETIAATPSKTV